MGKLDGLKNGKHNSALNGITRISVSGYKSISSQCSLEMRPLTILAGANSTGKSSIIQPLLLLKQTLEAGYDPVTLLLDGPNVKFTSADQFQPRADKGSKHLPLCIGISVGNSSTLTVEFAKNSNNKLDILKMIFERHEDGDERIELHPEMTHSELEKVLPPALKEVASVFSKKGKRVARWEVLRQNCFLALALRSADKKNKRETVISGLSPSNAVESHIRRIIHLPGLRGNPERFSPVTAVGSNFRGTFENYTASVILQWQGGDQNKLKKLSKDLEKIGLTWKVVAKPVNDTQVELQVGRLTHAARSGAQDLVNIADVGFGVSQTLPILVALHIAEPGQIVYLEQPEIHLHPRAQSALAEILTDAAKRGVRVVAETHSSLLLLGIQTLVAEGKLQPELVKLHWFSRNKDGETTIRSADLDDAGAFGNWPEDFADVALEAESRYLDAAEARQHIH